MKSVNLNKSCLCETIQWVNTIFNGRGKTSHKWLAVFVQEIIAAT